MNLNLSVKDFLEKGNIVQLGYEPLRIDIMTSITGVSFSKVWENKSMGKYGGEDVFFIGLKELIQNKEKTGRKQDMIDLDILKD